MKSKLKAIVFIFTMLSFISSCKEKESPYIPTPDLFTRNFTKNIPKNTEVVFELKEILNTETLFCETSFNNKKIEFIGDNDNLFVSDVDQLASFTYLSVYRQKIKNKDDIFVVKSRCCPMGPCFTTYFFKKQPSGQWKLFDTIPGEVIDYKKTKDHTTIKIKDEFMTGLTYIGFWEDKKFEPLISYRQMNMEIPTSFTQTKRTLTNNTELNLLKKPRDYHIDNLAFRIKATIGTNIYILSEAEKHYFIMVKATPLQINNLLENYKGDSEDLIEQIQGINTMIKNTKDFENLLNKTFYNIGWIEKF